MKLKFLKSQDRWYVDLPDFVEEGGDESDLEMVAGADIMLNILSNDEDSVTLNISPEPITDTVLILNFKELYSEDNPQYGANYIIKYYKDIYLNLPVWLCYVTLYVFKEYPKTLYISYA